MKKFLKFFLLLIAIAVISGLVYLFLLSPDENFQSIYLVPKNAAYIIETERPFDAWDKIVHNRAWSYMKTNKLLAGINQDIEKADSIVTSNRLLMKLLGSRKVMISSHQCKPGKFDFLYVADLKKTSKLKSAKNYLNKLLGDNYRLTQREYKGYEIMELFDKKSGDIYYFSFIRNQLIFSQVATLIEASVDQLNDLTLGRDLNYIDVARRTQGRGLFSICINYPYFKNYMASIMGKSNDFVNSMANYLFYTSAYFDLDDQGLLTITGYTSIKDTSCSFFTALVNSGNGPHDVLNIVPQRTASVIDFGFDDINSLYKNFNQTSDKQTRQNVNSTIEKTEKHLKINFRENFLDWIDNEIALIQTQPSNLGRQNEFAVIFKAKNGKSARENLLFLAGQLKKNSPVKFREIDYKNYTISYLHIPGIFKFLFGKMLERLEKPYFSVIDNWVVFSNHPQTIKSIIDDYESGKTISKSGEVTDFIHYFPNKSLAFQYLQTPVLFTNLKEFVSQATWLSLEENKKYIESFPDIGIHLDSEKDLLKIEIKARFNPYFEEFKPVHYLPEASIFYYEDTTSQAVAKETEHIDPKIVIDDLDASKHEEFYENGKLKLEVDLKKGLKQGNFREYYDNGEIKIRGKYKNDLMDGTWKYYDENGKITEKKEFDEGILIEN